MKSGKLNGMSDNKRTAISSNFWIFFSFRIMTSMKFVEGVTSEQVGRNAPWHFSLKEGQNSRKKGGRP